MNRVLSPCWHGARNFTVSFFIDQVNCRWREDLLDYHLMDFEVAKVKAIPLPRMQQQDTLTWPHNPTGEYIMKSGYKFPQKEFQNQQLGPSNPEAMKPLWQEIWKLDVPSKVKNLVWRACKDSLPTKSNLVRRRIIDDDTCDCCKSHSEDMIHTLYSCLKLPDLWSKCPQWKQAKLL